MYVLQEYITAKDQLNKAKEIFRASKQKLDEDMRNIGSRTGLRIFAVIEDIEKGKRIKFLANGSIIQSSNPIDRDDFRDYKDWYHVAAEPLKKGDYAVEVKETISNCIATLVRYDGQME